MSRDPVYFQGQLLPTLRDGYVWGIRVHPSGRTELRQCLPDDLVYVSDAVKLLQKGYVPSVWLDDLARVMILREMELNRA